MLLTSWEVRRRHQGTTLTDVPFDRQPREGGSQNVGAGTLFGPAASAPEGQRGADFSATGLAGRARQPYRAIWRGNRVCEIPGGRSLGVPKGRGGAG